MKFLENIKNIILPKEDNDSHEFKPILSEIEDRPINPIGPTIFWIIILFIFIALSWMYFGKVDVVVTARGVVIPNGEEKIVQSLDKGVVRELQVKEGDYVKQGQTVAIITPAEYEPGLELNNLEAEERGLQEQIASNRSRLKVALENKQRLDSVRDIIQSYKYDEAVNEVNSLRHEIGRLSAQVTEIHNRRLQLEKQKQILVSPIDGYVGQLFIHTIGGVVAPTDKIMSVVPNNTDLVVKADVMNQDIGFVKEKMPVSIKVDTYNFQKYGMLNGVVEIVSPNSKEDERLGLIYEVYIKPQNHTLYVEGKNENLKIGMTTTNEIKIGKRRIIEFFIYPIIKYLDESIKVR